MKNIIECIINESRQIEYRVSLLDVINRGVPASVSIIVDKNDQVAFEDWLKDQQDNIFGHADGGNIEY